MMGRRPQCNLRGWQLSYIGVSEAVRNRHALFLTELESVTLIDSAKTELVYSESLSFVASCLFIDARLRRSALQSASVVIGHRSSVSAV